jgi:hypothetical protein
VVSGVIVGVARDDVEDDASEQFTRVAGIDGCCPETVSEVRGRWRIGL